MMKVFFGAAIQGVSNRGERASVYRHLIDGIKSLGHTIVTEHAAEKDYAGTRTALEKTYGELPEDDLARRTLVRNKMIEAVEGDIGAAIFEVSTPSLGTGIEIAHAYLRPRLGLSTIPVLALYQKGYWPHHLSTMIRGIPKDAVPQFILEDYETLEEAGEILKRFLTDRARSH